MVVVAAVVVVVVVVVLVVAVVAVVVLVVVVVAAVVVVVVAVVVVMVTVVVGGMWASGLEHALEATRRLRAGYAEATRNERTQLWLGQGKSNSPSVSETRKLST